MGIGKTANKMGVCVSVDVPKGKFWDWMVEDWRVLGTGK